MNQSQVQQILRDADLMTPLGTKAAPSDIFASPWFANGIVQTKGVCYEVRLCDSDADVKRTRRDELDSKLGIDESNLKSDRDQHANAALVDQLESQIASEHQEHDMLSAELDRRAAAWQKQVIAGLGDYIMKDGSEVLRTGSAQAIVFTLPVTRKPSDVELDKLNRQLMAADSTMVDVRAILRPDRGFDLSACAVLPDGMDAKAVVTEHFRSVIELADKVAPKLIPANAVASEPVINAAVVEDIALVEDPVQNFVSPITRVVNFVISQFTEVPPADQKLHSLARELCKDDQITHARADTLVDRNGLHIIAVPNSTALNDPAAWRSNLLKDVRDDGASLKLTVPQPVVGDGIVPLRYNYMSGYIYVFIMVLIGFALIRYFIHLEKVGKVRKLGAEEAEREEHHHKSKQEATDLARHGDATSPENEIGVETYTPGYFLPKLMLVALGLLITGLALVQAWPDVKLLIKGEHAQGSVVAVIIEKQGLPEIILKTQAELIAKTQDVLATKDYGWTFYDEFAFDASDGKQVTFRRDVGCKLRPALPFLDDFGLPTTATLRYDQSNPSLAMLPLEYSTWFVPALIGLLGIMTTLTGAILAWYAHKPIVLHSTESLNIPAA